MPGRFSRPLATASIVATLGLALTGCGPNAASSNDSAASYPTKPITFIVPYAAGGPTDVTARALAPCLSNQLGKPVVAENAAGGSGAVGLQKMIGKEADGHTLALITTGTVALTPLANSLDYSKDDVTPIGVVSRVPFNLVVGKDSPYNTAEEFFAAAKDSPGTLNVGVSGASTPQAIELQRLRDQYDVDLSVVPFDGSAGATTALLGGHSHAALLNDAPEISERIEDGSFRVLATTGEERQAHIPDTPTLAELGYEDLTLAVTTYGLAGPAGLPTEVVEAVGGALEECLQDPRTIEAIGKRFIPEQYGNSQDLQRYIDEGAHTYEAILGKS